MLEMHTGKKQHHAKSLQMIICVFSFPRVILVKGELYQI